MTREQIAEIRARADAATPGPWENCGGYSCMVALDDVRAEEVFRTLAPGHDVHNPSEHETRWREDCEFLCHAREDVPALCDAIEEAIDEIGRLLHICDELRGIDKYRRLMRSGDSA